MLRVKSGLLQSQRSVRGFTGHVPPYQAQDTPAPGARPVYQLSAYGALNLRYGGSQG